jgi:protein NrfD
VGALLSGLLLTLDLGRPLRFWHMLIASNTGEPILKLWSPISFGSWALLFFGLFTFLAALAAAHEDNRLRWRPLRWLVLRPARIMVALLAAALGLFIASYTGILISVTNRPIWADSTFTGVLFLFSGVSSAAAALILLSDWRLNGTERTQGWLVWLDRRVLILELVALVAFLISLGSVARAWLSVWGLLLLVGVILLGIFLPLALESRADRFGARIAARPARYAAAFVLVGALLLRLTIMLASDGIHQGRG